jgi:hypothetical protein
MLLRRIIPAVAVYALLLSIGGCGKAGHKPADSPDPGVSLPVPTAALAGAARTASGTPEVLGADFDAGLPNANVTTTGDAAVFDSSASPGGGLSEYAYAIYRLSVDGLNGAESLTVAASGPELDSINGAWFGVANFVDNTWEWKQFNVDPEGFGNAGLLMLPERIAGDGSVFVAVVTPPSLPLTLHRLFFDLVDEVEDNDTEQTAQALPGLNFERFRGSLYVRDGQPSVDGDREDWFSVDGVLAEGQTVELEVLGFHESTDFEIEIYDATGDDLSSSSLGGYTDFAWVAGAGFNLDLTDLPLKIRMWCEEDEPGWSYPGGNYYITMRSGFKPRAALEVTPRDNPAMPATVTFDASGTTDTDANILRYEWDLREIETVYDFEDEYREVFSTTDPTMQRTFSTPGIYEARLRVVDATGFESYTDLRFRVGPSIYDELEDNDGESSATVMLPAKAQTGMLGSLGELDEEFHAGIYAENDGDSDDYYVLADVPAGQSLLVRATQENGDNALFDVFTFVDEVINEGISSWWDGASQELNNTGVAAPVYVRASIDYIAGTSPYYGDYRLTWVVGTAPTNANYTYVDGAEPHQIDFAASATDADGSIVRYEWDFDDDDVKDAEGQNVSFTYPGAGSRTVRLLAFDDDGLFSRMSKTVVVP